jgi:hypothetical protein
MTRKSIIFTCTRHKVEKYQLCYIHRAESVTAVVEYKFRWRQHGANEREKDQVGEND